MEGNIANEHFPEVDRLAQYKYMHKLIFQVSLLEDTSKIWRKPNEL